VTGVQNLLKGTENPRRIRQNGQTISQCYTRNVCSSVGRV